MNDIHVNNDVNNITECKLLHDILNTSKSVKSKDYSYTPILNGCINTCRG